MKNYTVRRYNPEDSALWNAFISTAKNATFLFHRDFMEYHADRFEDYSLLVFEEKKLVSVVPVNRVQNTVYSHQGLTYGGFVFNDKIKIGKVIAVMQFALKFLNENKIDTFQLKLIPSIYHTFFSEEIEYALFLAHAKLTRRDCLSVLDLTKDILYSKIRKRGIKKGYLNSLNFIEEDDLSGFWNEILIPNLALKHHVKPVHSLSEISLLRQKFPNNIRQFNIYHKDKIVAGTTVFVSDNVVHAQYISGNDDKNKLGSLDFLFNYLIKNVFKDKTYFDFGISHEDKGQKINEGLLYWKESFGANSVTQDFYEVATKNYTLLNSIMI